jgi:hypothetical protein
MRMPRGALIALIATGIASAPAQASVDSVGGYKFVNKEFELEGGKTKRLKAMCPDGTHVYGGGQFNPGDFGEFVQAQSYPVDGRDKNRKPDDGFEVLAKNLTGAPIMTTVQATCGKPKATYKAKRKKISGAGSSNEVDSRCPDNKPGKLVGGGVSGPKKLLHNDGGPTSNGTDAYYYAYMTNNSQQEITAKVWAICAKVKTTYIEDGAQAPAQTQTPLSTACPVQTVALDGGMGSTGGVDLNGSLFNVQDPRQWFVFGDNKTAGLRTISVNVVCAEHP